jgi:hypothetical protein
VDPATNAAARRRRRRRKTKLRCATPRQRRRHPKLCAKKKRKPRRTPSRLVPLQPLPPPPAPPAQLKLDRPIATYSGEFGVRQAERLLWRAGFGPSPGHAQALASMGLHAAVAALTRPEGAPTLTGAEPTDDDGNPIAPADFWATTTSGSSTGWCARTSRSWSA